MLWTLIRYYSSSFVPYFPIGSKKNNGNSRLLGKWHRISRTKKFEKINLSKTKVFEIKNIFFQGPKLQIKSKNSLNKVKIELEYNWYFSVNSKFCII